MLSTVYVDCLTILVQHLIYEWQFH